MASSVLLLIISTTLLASSTFLHQADAGWLPDFVCNNIQNRFLRLGCLDRNSVRCRFIYSQIVFTFFGIPACDFVACNGYGNALGTCVSSSGCFRDNRNAFCETGQVCCEVLATTTTTTTTTTLAPTTPTTTTKIPSGGGGSDDDSSSGSSSMAADNMVDMERAGGYQKYRKARRDGVASRSNESK